MENKEDIHIDIQNNTLNISGSIHKITDTKEDNMYQSPNYESSFQQLFLPPSTVSEENVETSYNNG
ncbi:Hsp20/alpha crystallin family protein [Gracilibacillus sp. D59]|uniref:Hsp20/alpha crystallin family protein n=1 Tax=Gracilibacillus sp. D59 TaxID=3457434 RepID=UPI003FCC3B2E